MSYYAQVIKEAAPEANARWVEAWMRLEHGTLDGLSRAQFKSEVAMAIECIATAGPEESERLAASYGLRERVA